MEKWNEICYLINNHKKKNSKESDYQTEIINIFEKLGWSRFNKEIMVEKNIRVGSTNNVKPDIIIKKENENIFVIEIKRPNAKQNSKTADQLISYMRLNKLNYGIFIGDNIELYYDEPNNKENPIKVFESKFIENNEKAEYFIKLISKSNFSEEKLAEFCEEKMEEIIDKNIAKDLLNELVSKKGIDIIKDLLNNHLASEYNENIIQYLFENLNISITKNSKTKHQITKNKKKLDNNYSRAPKLPIELIPNDIELFKKKFIEKGYAIREFHYEDGHIEIKKWINRNFKENASLISNIRSIPVARKGLWKEKGIVKLICKIED